MGLFMDVVHLKGFDDQHRPDDKLLATENCALATAEVISRKG
jgi:hypothetical protein